MKRLQELRLEKGISQVEAAMKSELSLAAYRRIERGHRNRIPIQLLCKIADYNQVNLDCLFDRMDER